jgi:putative glutamine amidotransferase
VLEAGGLPVHLPIDVDPAEVVDRLDGLLLTGGADIGPDRYGSAPETDLYPPEPDRDEFELGLLGRATELALPTLGICRGLQMINVHAGGTLHQHVPTHAAFDKATTTESHEVTFEPDSTLGALYGESRGVNSLHHQTIDRVGAQLRVTARSGDGTIEGIEHLDLPVVAVQWHPEMMLTHASDPLFTWLVGNAEDASRS